MKYTDHMEAAGGTIAGSSPGKHNCIVLAVLFIKFMENYMLLQG